MKRGLLLIALLAFSTASPTFAGKPFGTCWIEGGWLYAIGLPIDTLLALTTTFYPTGVSWTTPDGTFAREYGYPSAYFWTRGGGPSLRKPGPQLNDFRLVAECNA